MSADASQLRAAITRYRSGVAREAGIETNRLIKADRRVPRGTSARRGGNPRLVDSIRLGSISDAGTSTTVRVDAPVIQAATTDKGARPHVIVPRRARVLAFPSGGRMRFAHRVNHPGNKPMNWWEPTVTDAFRQALPVAARKVSF